MKKATATATVNRQTAKDRPRPTNENSYYIRDMGPEWMEFRRYCDKKGWDFKWALLWFIRRLPKDDKLALVMFETGQR